jgi:hypothetical protein
MVGIDREHQYREHNEQFEQKVRQVNGKIRLGFQLSGI